MKNPATAKEELKKRILSYVNLALPIKDGMSHETWQEFEKFQNRDTECDGLDFVKSPYLEVAKEYARANKSLGDLAPADGSGLLHPAVAEAFAKYLLDDDSADPSMVYPYLHQYHALEQVIGKGKNLVVCTGTGSGKTESFLLPLIESIYRSHELSKSNGTPYKHHVRALILYPMNALVNDQISRLRRLLRHLPDITFGQFIGTTAHKGVESTIDPDLVDEVAKLKRVASEDGKPDLCPVECLPNELRTRDQWKEPADILVTNYSMLERLLLLPESQCSFFKDCWDFIVIDEAHSYTGSVGTEIAWLMRRLDKRLHRNATDKRISYLATSATLSDGEDWKDKAEEFAASIFPIDKDSVHVEGGVIAVAVAGDGPTSLVDMPTFFTNNKPLYDQTIQYEYEISCQKSEYADVQLMSQVVGRAGKISCEELNILHNRFDLSMSSPIHFDDFQDIRTTDALITLAKLVLAKVNIMRNGKPGVPGEYDNWRDFLHDITKRAPSPIDNDSLKIGDKDVKNRRGNRLDILDLWKRLAREREDVPEAIPYIAFYYLYAALLELVRETQCVGDNLHGVELELTPATISKFSKIIEKWNESKSSSAKRLKELNASWKDALGLYDVECSYPQMLFNAVTGHFQMKRFRELSIGKPLSLEEYAEGMGISPQGFLQFAAIGALAKTPKLRNAAVEIRYHQVVRSISDVGVYFEGGDNEKPHFTRIDAETMPSGEKIFSLGICRDCGQPYLLGYAEDHHFLSHAMLMRATTRAYHWLYAVAIGTPYPVPGYECEMSDKHEDRWVNLMTGDLSEVKGTGEGWVPAYWQLEPNDSDKHTSSYIGECPRCGTKQSTNAKYGIITPYEAVGEQYKIAVLDAFASLAEEDANPAVRDNATAQGRKVLAFSDSRSKAARLACDFEVMKETRLADKTTLDLVSATVHKTLTPKAMRAEDEILRQMKNPGANIQVLGDKLQQLRRDPVSLIESHSINCLIGNGEENCFKKTLERLRYLQLLEWESEDGVIVDEDTMSRFLMLKTVRDTARYGLTAQGLISVRSQTLKSYDGWDDLKNKTLNISADEAKQICQSIFQYLVLRRKVILPQEFQKNGGDDGDYLDVYERKGITRAGFKDTRKNRAVYASCFLPAVLKCLGAETLTTEQKQEAEGWLGKVFSLFKINKILHAISVNSEEYALSFRELCHDLEILRENPESGLAEVMPFSIEEHTAQIEGSVGALYQKAFAEGRINILSCSTTFEMGIDVGGLNNVFLGNLPPASSNYRQRAGRAGRRPGAAAYILSLAGANAHDQNYYENVPSLFWGEIEPPRIYLRKPVFAARHFRAEALHDFIEYIVQHQGKTSNELRRWEKVSDFVIGWRSDTYRAENVLESRPVHCKDYCSSLAGEWKNKRGTLIKKYIESINDFDEFKIGLGDGFGLYSPAEDLVFQLLGNVPVKTSEPAFRFYQNMGGCRLPERIGPDTVDSDNIKRMPLHERLWHQLYMRRKRGDATKYEQSWPFVDSKASDYKLTVAQNRLLRDRTIDVLSESCILPRYGFPVDEIELLLDKNELYGNVELRRSLQLGLFEYAPGQVVVANKRKYESRTAAFWRYPTDNAPKESLASKLSSEAAFCRRCHKLYDLQEDPKKHLDVCPLCCQPLDKNCKFITPDVFYANRSVDGSINKVPKPKGHRIVRWGGKLIAETPVQGTCLETAESSDRMMQYINTNADDEGFVVHLPSRDGEREGDNERYYYVHEIQTNIAVWSTKGTLPFSVGDAPEEGISRFDNACLSAAYALRRSCAKKLDVSARDLGVLYIRDDNHESGRIQARFVFFDTAAGGGGNALALTMEGEDDTTTADLIVEIIKGAVALIRNDDNCSLVCGKNRELRPLPVNIYRTLPDASNADARPSVSCYKCIKDFDNQDSHAMLDKYDALSVLEALLTDGGAASATVEYFDWVKFNPGQDHLKPMKWYKKFDGKEVKFNPITRNLAKEDVEYRRSEK